MEPEKKKGFEINYLYFGALFVVLLLTSSSSIFLKDNLSGSRFFFFFYAAVQAALETGLFICLSALAHRFLGKKAFSLVIGCTFVFLFIHLADFVIDRITDLSIWDAVAFISQESLENLFYLLDASGVPLWGWGILTVLMLSLPFWGLLFYRWSEKVTRFQPVALRREWLLQFFFCMPLALLFWDYSASRVIHPDTYTAFLQSLPWKFTFLQPKTVLFPLSDPLRAPKKEMVLKEEIEADTTVLAKKPNIYLFIVESLRGDAINSEGAPHLYKFKQEALQPERMLSNANGTHLSWFSIFHSQFSFFWNEMQKEKWSTGSGPLRLLKKWGYKVRLYTSAQLGYFSMETLLFGKDRELVDVNLPFHHVLPVTAADSDAKVCEVLQKDLADPNLQEGQVFIVFWDATHFDYSWPKDWTPKFTPYAKEFAYFNAYYSQNKIDLIRNRYRNAVHFVDHLFGKFLASLPNRDEAIIALMGDHGEEFFERGHLFHNSHLVNEQTHIPILVQLGNLGPEKIKGTLSHMDLFPTILHYLKGEEVSLFEGRSVFGEERWPFTLISRFNAGRTPYEFCLHNGKHKLIAQFTNRRNIFASKELHIRSVRGLDDRPAFEKRENPMDWVEEEFGPAFDRLFRSQ